MHNIQAMTLSDDGISCSSIGLWQASTKTCTLSRNVTGSIEIRANGITIDGNGYSIVGNQTTKMVQDWLNEGGGMYEANRLASGILIDTKEKISIKNLQIEGFQDAIHVTDGININLSGNTIHDNFNEGLYVSNSKQITITNNHFVHNSYGTITYAGGAGNEPVAYVTIFIDKSQGYTISQNTFSDNGGSVIVLWNANGESIIGNIIHGSKHNDKSGVMIMNGTNVTVSGNDISNIDEGIQLQNSDHCVISKNNLSQNRFGVMIYTAMTGLNLAINNLVQDNVISNNGDGIYLVASGTNIIVNNIIDSNSAIGIELTQSTGNKIYNNDFINNVKQVIGGSDNSFTDGVKGGNYWSDYSLNCTDENNDGICDKPYPFEGGTVGVTDSSVWVQKDGWKYTSQVISQPVPQAIQSHSNSVVNMTNAMNTQSKIPQWMKNVFVWYGENKVSEDEVLNAIKFLVNQGIVKLN